MTHFTQEDADAVREKFTLFSKFSRLSDGACAIDDMEPQGRFMNVFMTMRNDAVDIGAFTACRVLGDALTMALPEGEWELVQAMITRESGVLRIRVRIAKTDIKPNNERQKNMEQDKKQESFRMRNAPENYPEYVRRRWRKPTKFRRGFPDSSTP